MIKQNPFSLYDFLGYFIPGAILIYFICAIKYINNDFDFDIESYVYDMSVKSEFQIDKLLFFTIFSYSLGHLLSFISSITIEKYSICKYGYPSKYLLFYDKEKRYFDNTSGIARFWRLFLLIIIFPISACDYIFGELLIFKNFYTRTLDKLLIDLIKLKANNLLKELAEGKIKGYEKGETRNYDFFRIISHYTYETSKNHQFRMTNYVVLYGFLRTLTLIFVLFFWYLIIHFIFIIEKDDVISFILLIIGVVITSYIFFMAFMKFYRRYSLECFMVLAIEKKSNEINNEVLKTDS